MKAREPSHRRSRRRALSVELLVALTVLATMGGCGSAPVTSTSPSSDLSSVESVASPPPEEAEDLVVDLDFDDLPRHLLDPELTDGEIDLENSGVSDIIVRVSALGGAALESAPDAEGGHAVRLPTLERSGDPRRVVLTVTAPGLEDPLGPGEDDFSFGADFLLDEDADASEDDNGNNLVQRGRSSSPAMYKIQVDHGEVSCRIVGDRGETILKSPVRVETEQWYRVSCSRAGDLVTLSLGRTGELPEEITASATTGRINLIETVPLAIGGKATSSGDAVARNTDQFNGAIDRVFLRVDREP